MKDSEFIELLNLYLDHEISAADAARLEAEVQSNPSRRHVYQDYCRMQKACKLLAQDFAGETEVEDRKVVAFAPAHASRQRRLYVTGAFAAVAACVAAIFVLRHGQVGTAPNNDVAISAPSAANAPGAGSAAPQMIATAHETIPTVIPASATGPTNSFSLRSNAQAEALAIATKQIDPKFVWMQDVKLTPLQIAPRVDQLRYDSTTNTQTGNRTYSNRQSLPQDVQWTAIRFQR